MMTSHGMPRQRARATQATLHVMRERGVMRGPGGAGARARLVPCVEVSAVVEESLGRVGLAVDRRQVQQDAALRAELLRCGVGRCVAAAQVPNEPPRGRRKLFAGGAAGVWSGGAGVVSCDPPARYLGEERGRG